MTKMSAPPICAAVAYPKLSCPAGQGNIWVTPCGPYKCGVTKRALASQREMPARPPEVTAVLAEKETPPPAIISTPTVVPAEELILGMPKKTAKIVGGVGAGLFLLLLFR